MKNIKKNGNYWFVEENGEIVFQGPDEEACKQYIRREAVTFFRYGMALEGRTTDTEQKEVLFEILDNLPEEKQNTFENFIGKLVDHGFGCMATVNETERGIYIVAENSPFRFSCWVKNDGTIARKPRLEIVKNSLVGWWEGIGII